MARQGGRYREAKVERDEENGKLEVERVVQIIVIYDNAGREHYPDGNDDRCRQLLFRFGSRAGGRGRQWCGRMVVDIWFVMVVEEISMFNVDGTATVLEELL